MSGVCLDMGEFGIARDLKRRSFRREEQYSMCLKFCRMSPEAKCTADLARAFLHVPSCTANSKQVMTSYYLTPLAGSSQRGVLELWGCVCAGNTEKILPLAWQGNWPEGHI